MPTRSVAGSAIAWTCSGARASPASTASSSTPRRDGPSGSSSGSAASASPRSSPPARRGRGREGVGPLLARDAEERAEEKAKDPLTREAELELLKHFGAAGDAGRAA